MRVAPASEETLGQRNKSAASGHGLRRVEQNRVSEWVFNADGGGTGEDVSLSRAALAEKGVIVRVLSRKAAEVGLGAKITRGNAAFGGGVAAARAFQIVVAAVAHVEKIRHSYPGWGGEKRNEGGGDLNVAGLHAAVAETVGERRPFLVPQMVEDLQDLQSALQTRSEEHTSELQSLR